MYIGNVFVTILKALVCMETQSVVFICTAVSFLCFNDMNESHDVRGI